MNQFKWIVEDFDNLNVSQWHKVLMLRADVFVVEQNCVYQDPDLKDPKAKHVLCFDKDSNVIATARILDEGISYDTPSIGRVVVKENFRGTGISDQLMKKSINTILTFCKKKTIKISAQKHLTSFYERYGFKTSGSSYLEDDIPHILMIRKP